MLSVEEFMFMQLRNVTKNDLLLLTTNKQSDDNNDELFLW